MKVHTTFFINRSPVALRSDHDPFRLQIRAATARLRAQKRPIVLTTVKGVLRRGGLSFVLIDSAHFLPFSRARAFVDDHSISSHACDLPPQLSLQADIDIAIRQWRVGTAMNDLCALDGFLMLPWKWSRRRDIAVLILFPVPFVSVPHNSPALRLFHFFGVIIDANDMMA